MRRLVFVLLGAVLVTAYSPFALGETNPHHEAKKCRANYTADCDEICSHCHLPPYGSPATWKVDIYSESDRDLCSPCHSEKLHPGDRGYLLPGHAGSHPNGILFDPWGRPGARLNPYPSGPKLFCDQRGGNCKVMCSTCHNPMGDARRLLRVTNNGSALCLSCHNL